MLCSVCCNRCCTSQERINASAVLLPLSSHLPYPEFSEKHTQWDTARQLASWTGSAIHQPILCLVGLWVMVWSLSLSTHAVKDLAPPDSSECFCLQSLFIREDDVKSCWTGRHLNLWGYFTAVLVSTDEHSHFQDWFVCFPTQSPLHSESAISLNLESKFPGGTHVGGKSTQLPGSHMAPCSVIYLLISGERLWIGDS